MLLIFSFIIKRFLPILPNNHSTTLYFANRLSIVVIDLNSRLFPDGSLKNIVHCSPGCPLKRKCGGMINSIPASSNFLASAWNCSSVNARPK